VYSSQIAESDYLPEKIVKEAEVLWLKISRSVGDPLPSLSLEREKVSIVAN